MDGNDAYHSRSGPLPGSNPFGEQGYSDQFVRSATQPLARKPTRPLAVTPESYQQQLRAHLEQVHLCRTIVERFAPRVRILRTAHETFQKLQAKKAPPAAPRPAKPLGLKKPIPAAPPASPEAPLSVSEKLMSDRIAKRLGAKPDLARRAAIAMHQFVEARQAVAEAVQHLDKVQAMTDLQLAWNTLGELEVTKLQGRIYPICNFYEVFKDDDLIYQLFPPPKNAAPTQPKPGTGRISFGS